MLNRAIQQILKPKLHELKKGVWQDLDQKSDDQQTDKSKIVECAFGNHTHDINRTVKFSPEAKMADCFDSALKVLRIWAPNTIELQNQELEDVHMEMLLDFMRNKEQIITLNLRKNKIGNEGAILLADFITNQDSTLLEVDLDRNRIEEDGAQELVDSIHKTIRIEKFQIGFGNLISSYLINAFDQELLSNQQIKDNLF